MANKSNPAYAEALQSELESLFQEFSGKLPNSDLRGKVQALVPAYKTLRRLSSSLISKTDAASARARILHYFRQYPRTPIHGDELMVVSGIQEWARRVRELRVQFGWRIYSGAALEEMAQEDEISLDGVDLAQIDHKSYLLLDIEQDNKAAERWQIANSIRKRKDLSVQNRILAYLKKNVGSAVDSEELRYVAGGKSERGRRVRELRTEHGWPIVTKYSGWPDLPVGIYLLEADRQSPAHDRRISDPVRREVLLRDKKRCQMCGWSKVEWDRSDPRHLELHHKKPHAEGGENIATNLITLCVSCHDEVHRRD